MNNGCVVFSVYFGDGDYADVELGAEISAWMERNPECAITQASTVAFPTQHNGTRVLHVIHYEQYDASSQAGKFLAAAEVK